MKIVKNGNFSEELLIENDFEAAKASEAVQKVATYQKEYRKCSLCVS